MSDEKRTGEREMLAREWMRESIFAEGEVHGFEPTVASLVALLRSRDERFERAIREEREYQKRAGGAYGVCDRILASLEAPDAE